MVIGIVTPFVYPHDQEIRVRKLAYSFNKAGYSIHVLCDSDEKLFELVDSDGIPVHRISFLNGIRKIHHLAHSPFPFNPVWYVWLLFISKKLKIKTFIVRDLRLSLPVVIIGKLTGIHTIADLGENFPAMHRFLDKSKIYIYMVETLENIAVLLADSIQVVTEENKSRLIKKFPSAVKKIEILTNAPMLSMLPLQKIIIMPEAFDDANECLKLVFIGLVDEFRGLELVLDALTFLEDDGIKYLLTIIGDGPHLPFIRNLAVIKGISRNVIYKGWISDNKYVELQNHHIGLVPHVDCELTQTTIPNKVFDYMSIGLPVLTTHLKPVAQIVHETRCGWIIPHEAAAMAGCLKKIILNTNELYFRGQNGYRAVIEKYNWESQMEPILKHIKSISTQYSL
jgi:glycosyltransferase involved in cell wall biosynthesis